MTEWEKAQKWETEWHGTCQNTYGEEEKQLLYADRMGLKFFHNGKSPYNIKLDRTVIDIGGGPNSLLLKAVGTKGRTVLDPMPMPDWVEARYEIAGITFINERGEDWRGDAAHFDEAWIYNCLQHTVNPEAVIQHAKCNADLIRIFEWIGTRKNVGHPHILNRDCLDEWLGGYGKVEELTGQANCFGNCYYGIFPT